MLTIGQVARHLAITTRTIRHYHRIGLLPEPARDASGYRRYDASAVVELIRIKTLADSGVPLSRIPEVLGAVPHDFAEQVDEIDRRLTEQIRLLEQRRRRLRALRAGDRSYLSDQLSDYLEALRAHDISDATVTLERDSWLLWTTVAPEAVSSWLAQKLHALDDTRFVELYRTFDAAIHGDTAARDRLWEETSSRGAAAYRSADWEELASSHPVAVRLTRELFEQHYAPLGLPIEVTGFTAPTNADAAEAPTSVVQPPM
ncbi:MerR family transcriptional regulator [Flexivirga meconopsidis]|uniref:MerR family transcriptional regulator n=1 Tax=Flexivirga meconopsidis TaxID=2977121 RepID=UPI00223FCD8D|nr:MerR family transcriptional regulator [Flexivirga meconopsidis]